MERPDQLPPADLNWGRIRRPRWRTIVVIVALHLIVISAVMYFNATIGIEALPTYFVDVIHGVEAAPKSENPPP